MIADPKEDLVKFFITNALEVSQEVLSAFCGLEVKLSKPIVREKDEKVSGITSTIGLTSAQVVGTIAMTFEKETFIKTMNRLLGENYDPNSKEVPNEIADGAAEILNQVFGHLKQRCNKKNVSFLMTLPTIIRGTDYMVCHKGSKNPFCVPIRTEFGTILFEVAADFNT